MNIPKLHNKIKDQLDNGAFGALHAIECTLNYSSIVDRGMLDVDEPIKKMAALIKELMFKSLHVTFNPINDKLLEMKTSNFEEAIFKYIEKNHNSAYNEMDNNSDIVNISTDMTFAMINLLPILEQDKIIISSSTILTAVTPIKIEV